MALSNTAQPKYYGEFREKVLTGMIPVCREIAMEMNRIDGLVQDHRYYYDDGAIDGFISYCEEELTLTNGDDLKLLDTFKLWAESLLAWFWFEEKLVFTPSTAFAKPTQEVVRVKHRLVNKQFLIVARGAAKSMYMSVIQSYFQNVDTSTTMQVATAPTMKQAEEVLSPIRTAITRSRGPLFQFLTEGSLQNTTGSRATRQKLAATKKGIENFLTGSAIEIRPMTIAKLQGLRSRINSVDEWLSGDIREDVISALEQGASKEKDWVIVAASSEGTVRNGAGDTMKMELLSILKGDYYAPNTSIWYYKLDDVAEVADPRMWPKAQPNIGLTVTYDTYQLDVERAEKAPAARNDILAKRFGLPMEGYTYFFAYEDTIVHGRQEFWKMRCAMGVDLSQGDDFTAFTFLFPLSDGSYGVKTRCYITELTLGKLPGASRTKYQEFLDEGSLVAFPGMVLDMDQVYEDLERYINNNEYDVVAVGFDPYNAKAFMQRWELENGPFGIEKVIQGYKSETVPLGEIRKVAEQRALRFDQSIMAFAMGNAVTLEDTNGNRKLMKKRYAEKIDPVSALMDGWVAMKVNSDAFA